MIIRNKARADQIASMYRSGLSQKEIADKLSLTQSTVAGYLKRMSIAIRPISESVHLAWLKGRGKGDGTHWGKIKSLYLDERKSSSEVARLVNVNLNTLRGMIRRAGIARSYSEAQKLHFAKTPRLTKNRICNGYYQIFMPSHHRANKRGYVFEHIFVWEQINGKLPEDWMIHHLNGVKTNNHLENLIAMPRHSHKHRPASKIWINALRRRIQELEAQLSQQKMQI